MNKRLRKQQVHVKKAKNSDHMGGHTAKIPAKLITKDKLSVSRSGKKHKKRPVRVPNSPIGKHEKKTCRYETLTYEPIATDEVGVHLAEGLDFPDNFMAIIGFKRSS